MIFNESRVIWFIFKKLKYFNEKICYVCVLLEVGLGGVFFFWVIFLFFSIQNVLNKINEMESCVINVYGQMEKKKVIDE